MSNPDRMTRPEAVQILRDFLATTGNRNVLRALECLAHAEHEGAAPEAHR